MVKNPKAAIAANAEKVKGWPSYLRTETSARKKSKKKKGY